ncbi:MFS transporter [Phenylobacterium terrae]|uniref:MFS transporter n=1 Tax=Phenylobacterium terrae TaxID=2665495 RepID=A0ABW4N3K4_9CAUL
MTHERRVVLSLAIAQALFQTSSVLLVTVGGLAGQMLAPDTALATLPIACVALGTAVATIPASLLMGRVGRRPGFVLGALLGAGGGALAAFAMLAGSFPLLCIATALVGGYQGFAQFYRFAAAEAASEAFRSRAISLVLAGGVVAALAGPHLGAATKDLIGPAAYAGSFLAVLALGLVSAVVIAATPLPTTPASGDAAEPSRPLPVIMRQPKFVAAVVGAAVGYAVMVLVMTATPLSMVGHHHAVSDAAFVIQWHVLGMFVPSFFTGWLVKRFGLTAMMLTGVGLLLTHVAVAMSGVALANFLSGLVLLGVGWNFLYVGGSTLLTETYRPSERARVQGLNDFLIVGVAAAASFSAGALVDAFGWRGLNLAATPFLAIAALAVVFGSAGGARRAVEAAPR